MDMSETQLKKWMEQCITLAKKADKNVSYPYVGALVLDSSGIVIGEGYKGQPNDFHQHPVHAEKSAIMDVTSVSSLRTRTATLVTTLDPCVRVRGSQFFKPCTQHIVENGIARVIIGLIDNSPPLNPGESIRYLRNRNVEVIVYKGLEERIVTELMPPRHRNVYFQTSIR